MSRTGTKNIPVRGYEGASVRLFCPRTLAPSHPRTLALRLPQFLFVVLALLSVPSFAQGTDQQLAEQYFDQGDFERAALYFDKLYKERPSPITYEYLF
ncbi:MAG TPA: hypothetical protein PKL41_04310, partial [Flavobacteriales bacterium]|nr:hypothetical protein [Flavobacteriales bacterium]